MEQIWFFEFKGRKGRNTKGYKETKKRNQALYLSSIGITSRLRIALHNSMSGSIRLEPLIASHTPYDLLVLKRFQLLNWKLDF